MSQCRVQNYFCESLKLDLELYHPTWGGHNDGLKNLSGLPLDRDFFKVLYCKFLTDFTWRFYKEEFIPKDKVHGTPVLIFKS